MIIMWARARMIINNQWKDYDTPPPVPLIDGGKTALKRSSFADSLVSAAVAIVKALKDPASPPKERPATSTPTSDNIVSPTNKAHLRSQYLKQLKEIQNLYDEGVLTSEEFEVHSFNT